MRKGDKIMPSKDGGFNSYRERNRKRRDKRQRKDENNGRKIFYVVASLIGVLSMLVELFTSGTDSKKSKTTKKDWIFGHTD